MEGKVDKSNKFMMGSLPYWKTVKCIKSMNGVTC